MLIRMEMTEIEEWLFLQMPQAARGNHSGIVKQLALTNDGSVTLGNGSEEKAQASC